MRELAEVKVERDALRVRLARAEHERDAFNSAQVHAIRDEQKAIARLERARGLLKEARWSAGWPSKRIAAFLAETDAGERCASCYQTGATHAANCQLVVLVKRQP